MWVKIGRTSRLRVAHCLSDKQSSLPFSLGFRRNKNMYSSSSREKSHTRPDYQRFRSRRQCLTEYFDTSFPSISSLISGMWAVRQDSARVAWSKRYLPSMSQDVIEFSFIAHQTQATTNCFRREYFRLGCDMRFFFSMGVSSLPLTWLWMPCFCRNCQWNAFWKSSFARA